MYASICSVPFGGYFVIIDGNEFHLKNPSIIFYDKHGQTSVMKLDYGCSFLMELGDIPFNVRKKENFTRNEVFVIREKQRDKYDHKNNARLYIPMASVDLVENNHRTEIREEHYIYSYKDININAKGYATYADQPHPNVIVNGDRISVKTFISYRNSDEWDRIIAFTEEMNKACDTYITARDMAKILKKYEMVKR